MRKLASATDADLTQLKVQYETERAGGVEVAAADLEAIAARIQARGDGPYRRDRLRTIPGYR
ncbi:hypothetical protein ACG33_03365 [Steroidobacter denitrificans]|uniref:Uncharacterized protein n=1 Tax=Steroidobacter denitrificans TaxID=465721 RepID=A0A127F974_STEDE|nr:hypothetical protein ACG33_03365 [Steroidobacter denitrificans]